MPVTEFAIIKLRGGYDTLEFLEMCMETQEIQDSWSRHHQPYNLNAGDNLSSMYTEITEPSSLLITAPWDSPEAHTEWIESGENGLVMGKLSPFLAPGCDSVLCFHMDPAGKKPQMRTAFKHKDGNEGFDICRLTTTPDQKEALRSKYQTIEDQLRKEGLESSIWAGWRIEKPEGEEDLIVFWSKSVTVDRLKGLLEFSDKKDHRRFRHLV